MQRCNGSSMINKQQTQEGNVKDHTSTSLFLLPSRRQMIHPKVMNIFKPMASQILEAIPVVFERPPAVIAPRNKARNAPIRRFRRGLTFAVNLGSTNKSHKSVVTTTVGISSSPRIREAQIWPPAWNARREMGRICIHSIGARGSSGFGVITPRWIRIAVARSAAVWIPKDIIIVERRRGLSKRCMWMKKILLVIKTVMAIKDLAQRYAG